MWQPRVKLRSFNCERFPMWWGKKDSLWRLQAKEPGGTFGQGIPDTVSLGPWMSLVSESPGDFRHLLGGLSMSNRCLGGLGGLGGLEHDDTTAVHSGPMWSSFLGFKISSSHIHDMLKSRRWWTCPQTGRLSFRDMPPVMIHQELLKRCGCHDAVGQPEDQDLQDGTDVDNKLIPVNPIHGR